MMEENSDVVLLAVVLWCTWPNQYTKNIPQHLFGANHLVCTYLMTDFSTSSPCTHLYTFWMTPLHYPVLFVLNGWPISQPKNKQEHLNIVFTKK